MQRLFFKSQSNKDQNERGAKIWSYIRKQKYTQKHTKAHKHTHTHTFTHTHTQTARQNAAWDFLRWSQRKNQMID